MNFKQHVDAILSASMNKFGETVLFYPPCGGVFEIQAVFDNEAQAVDLQTEQLVSLTQPRIGVNLNDIKFSTPNGTVVEIRKQKFSISEKREDGQGGAVFLLHRVRANERIADTKAR